MNNYDFNIYKVGSLENFGFIKCVGNVDKNSLSDLLNYAMNIDDLNYEIIISLEKTNIQKKTFLFDKNLEEISYMFDDDTEFE